MCFPGRAVPMASTISTLKTLVSPSVRAVSSKIGQRGKIPTASACSCTLAKPVQRGLPSSPTCRRLEFWQRPPKAPTRTPPRCLVDQIRHPCTARPGAASSESELLKPSAVFATVLDIMIPLRSQVHNIGQLNLIRTLEKRAKLKE